MNVQDFLLEIGTEELPPKALHQLASSLSESICNLLNAEGVGFTPPQQLLASPRRLAVLIEGLENFTPAKELLIWGPPTSIAFDANGNPSRAAQAFANKNACELGDLVVENDGKAEKLVYRTHQTGRPTLELLPGIILQALAALPIPKRMRWGAGRAEFVRPIHWLVALFGNDIVPMHLGGISAGRCTRGHRFHSPGLIEITRPADYVWLLRSARVIVDFEERSAIVNAQVTNCATQLGGSAVISPTLLQEVTALVEWPVALGGQFDPAFLDIPPEALVSSMKEHQKYFHVVDKGGSLLPFFITVANIESTDPLQVIAGNERVIRPRLSDAAFFFKTDQATGLSAFSERLKTVVFQQELGTLYDKSQRMQALAAFLAKSIGVPEQSARRAAVLAKADLVSSMVLEFDTMQGIAGYYYALNGDEDSAVALAIKEHYLPNFAGDILPSGNLGCAVALADRLDTLVGIFGIGQAPTGSRDPFALRRASLAVLRILVEKEFALDLCSCLQLAAEQYAGVLKPDDRLVPTVLNYMLERFRAWYEDAGIAAEVFMSVAAKQLSSPLDIDRRVQAVSAFVRLPEALSLAAANKRVSNILAGVDVVQLPVVRSALLVEPAEIALANSMANCRTTAAPLFARADYTGALCSLATLQQPVNAFFDGVMVMSDNAEVRNNRLALLLELRELFLHVADISLLVSGK